MKRLLHNLFLPLFAVTLCSGACSDDDNDRQPKPSGYDIYTAGYKTPSGKSVATVWKNGQELFDLSDGQASGCQPYAIAVYGGDIFTAGTLFGTTRTAVVWHGEDIRYTLTDGSGHGEAYSMYVVPRYD